MTKARPLHQVDRSAVEFQIGELTEAERNGEPGGDEDVMGRSVEGDEGQGRKEIGQQPFPA